MKKLYILLLIITSVVFSSCKKEQADKDLLAIESHITVKWIKTIDGVDMTLPDDYDNKDRQDLVINPDGSIIVSLAYYPDGASSFSNHLIKFDIEGNPVFDKQFDVPINWYPTKSSVIRTVDQGYLLYTYINESAFPYDPNAVIYKTDQDGNTLWTLDLDFWPNSRISNVAEKTGGELYILGTDSVKNFLLRVNLAGDTLGTTILDSNIIYTSLGFTDNGSLILAGYHYIDYSYCCTVGDIYAYDNSMNQLWHNELYGNQIDNCLTTTGMYINPDNSVVVISNIGDAIQSLYQNSVLFAKILNGTSQVNNYLNIQYGCQDIEPISYGGYLMITNEKHQIAKISEDGNVEWMQSINWPFITEGFTLKRLGNDYVMLAFHFDFESTKAIPVIIKFSLI